MSGRGDFVSRMAKARGIKIAFLLNPRETFILTLPQEIRTERLLLRRWIPSDRAPFAALNADRRVVEFLPGAFLYERFEPADELFQVLGRKPGVLKLVIAVAFVLEGANDRFKRLVIFARQFLDAEHDVPVHLDEAAVTVPGETLDAGRLDQRENRFVVEAEV